jgi:hypothetical protein
MIMVRIEGGAVPRVTVIFEEEPAPQELADFRETMQQFHSNSKWLSQHWKELLPQASGKYVAVAGQEAFIGDTHQEARNRALAAHPEDRGAFSQFVRPGKGPRVYAHQG